MLITFMVAISLSMDAFSLALIYGTIPMLKKDIILLSVIVGIYHFIMPIVGMNIGKFFINLFVLNDNLILMIIFIIVGIQMIKESKKENTTVKKLKIKDMLLFGLAVSMDSFSVGIGINKIASNYFISAFVFCIISFIFTYIGLILGNRINKVLGNVATLIGGLALILIGIIYGI